MNKLKGGEKNTPLPLILVLISVIIFYIAKKDKRVINFLNSHEALAIILLLVIALRLICITIPSLISRIDKIKFNSKNRNNTKYDYFYLIIDIIQAIASIVIAVVAVLVTKQYFGI